jgi:maltose alpha-D-glucosyltransferase / alpha-amylase
MARTSPVRAEGTSTSSSLWYRDAVMYEVHVRAFLDSNADGIGDFRGLTEKLDYLQDLGVTALWLLPFYPSPLKDDGYDIAMYKSIHPAYGSIRDFKQFMREARRRGLKVVTELVLNHTSDQHPWFQRSRRARPGTPWRDFYVWSETWDRYRDARVIFKDTESSNWTWDPVAQAYYWHRFYTHQPDLNFDNPDVRRAMVRVVDFWLEMGVDGLRLDAVPYLFEREGTTCENVPETFEFVRELRAHVDSRFPDRMLLAEANQWPEDAVAYFGQGDMCHMAFHFPLMTRMFMAIRMEDRYPIVDILAQTPAIPESSQWALFLRNHDELTLEMVTDEERDYMYRVYAEDPQARINLGIRRRLAPLLGNNRRLIEMMNGLLMSMPGTPVIYYGDEIGMGDNIYLGDRNGVRTPMQWSPDRNAGFSRANPQKLYLPVVIDPEYHYEALNVEAQQNNPHSLLWWMKRLIALRKRYRAFGRGSIEFLYPENRRILAFIRAFDEERILVVANLSRFAQYVELDLSQYRGSFPLELFGRTEFPRIGDLPYLLTLGPYSFQVYALQTPRGTTTQSGEAAVVPTIEVSDSWQEVLSGRARASLEEVLPDYLRERRWFGSRARRIKTTEIVEVIPVPPASPDEGREPAGYVSLIHVEFTEGDPQTYQVPIVGRRRDGEDGGEPPRSTVIARIKAPNGDYLLIDGFHEAPLVRALLDALARRRRMSGLAGRLAATPTRYYARMRNDVAEVLAGGHGVEPFVLTGEQSNSTVAFGDRLLLKLFRRPDEGENPDLEVGRFLTEKGFPNIPPVAGALEYVRGQSAPMTAGIFQGYVHNEGDGWQYTVDNLDGYVEDVLARQPEVNEPPLLIGTSLVDLAAIPPPELALEMFGTYLESARLLGRRTADLHLALASEPDDPSFAPEPFTPQYQRSMYQSMRSLALHVFRLLREKQHEVPQAVQLLDLETTLANRFRRLLETKIDADRIRVHGDYHLGQVLYTGKDFVIIDFEGEPARALSERRIKRSALRDVAGMLRSFHYAAYQTLFGRVGATHQDNPAFLEPWILFWHQWVSAAFLRAYLETASEGSFLPRSRSEMEVLIDCLLLEKAAYEMRYELNNRPDWVKIPIAGVLQLLETRP